MTYEIALALLMSQVSGVSVDPQELVCLSNNIYHEARGESQAGQIAVAYVTLNRVEKPDFGDTICEVVNDRHQFSWTSNGKSDVIKDREAYVKSMRVAINTIQGIEPDPTEGATYFYNPRVANPAWSREFTVSAVIGQHKFMRN
jgi:N-acetylmuramoyl-L-alanine amidase